MGFDDNQRKYHTFMCVHVWIPLCAVLLCYVLLPVCVCVFAPTSDDGCGGGAQGVTCFAAALLQPEVVELQVGSIQQLLGLLV